MSFEINFEFRFSQLVDSYSWTTHKLNLVWFVASIDAAAATVDNNKVNKCRLIHKFYFINAQRALLNGIQRMNITSHVRIALVPTVD